jgi:hypothetical protein
MRRIRAFDLKGYHIKVCYRKRVYGNEGDRVYGTCDYEKNLILIATHSPTTNEPLTKDMMDHSLEHEKLHFILFLSNRHDLNEDDDFVDGLAGYHHQAKKSEVKK